MASSARATLVPTARCRPWGQALADGVVDHRQDPETPPVGHLVGDEVQASALVGCQRRFDRPALTHGALATSAAAHRQPFLTVDPLDLLLVRHLALAPQQCVQAAIAEAPPLLDERLQPLSQVAIIGPPRLVAHARPIRPNHPVRPGARWSVAASASGDALINPDRRWKLHPERRLRQRRRPRLVRLTSQDCSSRRRRASGKVPNGSPALNNTWHALPPHT